MWFEDSVFTLQAHGVEIDRIPELTLPQFIIMLRAAERRDAKLRSQFVTDIGVTLGALLGGGDSLTKHLDLLGAVAREEKQPDGR